MQNLDIPAGYCQCGCGGRTEISRWSYRKRGIVAGQPLRFINGHNTKKQVDLQFLDNGTVLVPLSSKKRPGLFAEIDADDVGLVRGRTWHPEIDRHTVYARSYIRLDKNRNSYELLHRVIMSAPEGIEVDHVDGNGLNNRRSNLRLCNGTQNQANKRRLRPSSSRLRGVTWNARCGKWQAQIKINRRGQYLGLFESEIDAAVAYDTRASELFGEFARLNFPSKERAQWA